MGLQRDVGRRRDDERGVVLVVVAVGMVAILAVAALVIDIGVIRNDRRDAKRVTDAAVTAGVRELGSSPWAAVCTALDYLQQQSGGYASLTSLSYEDGNGSILPSPDPCDRGLSNSRMRTVCAPDLTGSDVAARETWARLTASTPDGSMVVEFEAPYDVAADTAQAGEESLIDDGDNGDPCTQMVVRVTRAREPSFAQVIGSDGHTSIVRSVARLEPDPSKIVPAALILLERHDCATLQVSGSNTRLLIQAHGKQEGVIQVDSAGDGACTNHPVIDGQATSGGPSIMACSTDQTQWGCSNDDPANAPNPAVLSRISVWGKLLGVPDAVLAPDFSVGTYGDTPVTGGRQLGRSTIDDRYLTYVRSLDEQLRDFFKAPGRPRPFSCGPLDAANRCIDSSTTPPTTWRVVSGSMCTDNAAATAALVSETNVYFNCGDVTVTSAGLSLPNTERVAFNGNLRLVGALSVPNAHSVWVYGRSGGNNMGIDIDNGGKLRLNHGGAASCNAASPTHGNVLAVLHGNYHVGTTTAEIRTCGTFAYLASGGSKLPTIPYPALGVAPCPSVDNPVACDDYNGALDVTSNATVSWTSYSGINLQWCRPPYITTNCYDDNTDNAFEDLAFWTEDATGNIITGGGSTQMQGIFFMPNANEFRMAGTGTLPISLNAQFIVRRMQVTGGASISLRPSPVDSITVPSYDYGLVR